MTFVCPTISVSLYLSFHTCKIFFHVVVFFRLLFVGFLVDWIL